jgi:hypothetical protein
MAVLEHRGERAAGVKSELRSGELANEVLVQVGDVVADTGLRLECGQAVHDHPH